MQPYFFHPRDLDFQADHLFWYSPPDDGLLGSLDRLGQTTPALVLAEEGKPVLVAGSRRNAALLALRGRLLAAASLDPHDALAPGADLSRPWRLGLLYLASNLERSPTDAMLVAAGRYFLRHGSADEFFSLAGPSLFAANDRRARLLATWLALPASLDALLAAGQVPLACGAALAGCDPDTLAALGPLLGAVRWSRANLDNALTWLTEAARLAGETPAVVLARSGALELCERGLSPNDLTAGLLAALRRVRAPVTMHLEASFTRLARELTRGSHWRMRPSQGFEADTVTVECTVRRPEELGEAARHLTAMAAHPDLPRILHLTDDVEDEA